jgi:hypothetical protein
VLERETLEGNNILLLSKPILVLIDMRKKIKIDLIILNRKKRSSLQDLNRN